MCAGWAGWAQFPRSLSGKTKIFSKQRANRI